MSTTETPTPRPFVPVEKSAAVTYVEAVEQLIEADTTLERANAERDAAKVCVDRAHADIKPTVVDDVSFAQGYRAAQTDQAAQITACTLTDAQCMALYHAGYRRWNGNDADRVDATNESDICAAMRAAVGVVSHEPARALPLSVAQCKEMWKARRDSYNNGMTTERADQAIADATNAYLAELLRAQPLSELTVKQLRSWMATVNHVAEFHAFKHLPNQTQEAALRMLDDMRATLQSLSAESGT